MIRDSYEKYEYVMISVTVRLGKCSHVAQTVTLKFSQTL